MTSESGAMPPLAVPVKIPWVRSPGSRMSVVELTFDRLRTVIESDKFVSLKAAYVAGVYACAAAVLNERAHARELAEAAWRIEHG